MNKYKFTPEQLNEINIIKENIVKESDNQLRLKIDESTPSLNKLIKSIGTDEELNEILTAIIDRLDLLPNVNETNIVKEDEKTILENNSDMADIENNTLKFTKEELLLIDNLKNSCENVFEALDIIYEENENSTLHEKIFKSDDVDIAIKFFVDLWVM